MRRPLPGRAGGKPRLLLPAVLLVCLVAGCGVPVDGGPRDLGRASPSTGASGPAPNGFGDAVERLYLVKDGVLVRTVRRVPTPPTPEQLLRALLAGPTGDEQQDGLTSALSTMRVGALTLAQRRASVAIGQPQDPGARSDEVLAYGQIVCSLTSLGAEVGTVSFTSGGQPLGVPRGDGSLSTAPLTIADYASLLAS